MPNWKELVAKHQNPQQDPDPQRATLRARAIAQVEEGLRHLASVGLIYDVIPRGGEDSCH